MSLRLLVAITTLALSGCSFFRANCVNDPAGTCSQKTVIFDYVAAAAAIGGGSAVFLAVPCDIEARDCNQFDALTRIVVPAVVVGVTLLASAVYGGSVVERCEHLRPRRAHPATGHAQLE
ncbi:MAG: hypothetical protein ACKV2T_13805 [Kofleriaceae bacterium]